MNCDYLVLLFLGFASKDSDRESGDDVGNNVSEILKEVTKYCKGDSGRHPFFPPPPAYSHSLDYERSDSFHDDEINTVGYYPYRVDDDIFVEEHVPNYGVPFQYDSMSPSRRVQILQSQFGELPIITGTQELVNVVNSNQVSMVRIPEPMVMNLVSPEQLSILYQNNQAFQLPSTDPSTPRLIAMTTRVLSSILKAKKRFHNVIDHGVKGAENVFSGIHEAAGGIAELIGGGAHGLLDFIV